MPKVDGKQIKDGTVDTAQLATDAVTEIKIDDAAVTNGKIANGAVDEAKLNSSVAGDGLTGGGGSALDVVNATNGAINVQADSVAVNVKATGAIEIEAGAIGELDVKNLGIDEARIAALAVTNGKIALLAVDTPQLAANAVTAAKADLTTPWSFTADNLQVTTAPDTDNDVANKAYVDSVASGLVIKAPCRVATNAALPSYTPSGSKVGKLITMNSVGVLTVDGVATVLGDRILVKNEGASHIDHGIYEVTTEGTAGVAAVLTRATDFDTNAEVVAGSFTFLEEGTAQADTGWVLTTDNPIDVDVDALTFSQFSGAGSYTAGAGITIAGTVVSITEVANSGIDVQTAGNGLLVAVSQGLEIVAGTPGSVGIADDGVTTARIINDAVTAAKLNADTAGAGLVPNGGTGALDVNPGNGIQISADAVAIKPDPTAGPSVAADGTGLRAAVPYISDKAKVPGGTSAGDDYDTAITITVLPANPSYVQVFFNGVLVELGDNDSGKECYFSSDGTEPNKRAISAIAAGDHFMWNGATAGYQITAADKIDLCYDYAS